MRQRIIKNKERETFEWTGSMIGVIIGLIFICIILLVSNNVHASNMKNNDIDEVLKMMTPESGETVNSVSYETVYVGNNKFIVFKSGSDIEVIRVN